MALCKGRSTLSITLMPLLRNCKKSGGIYSHCRRKWAWSDCMLADTKAISAPHRLGGYDRGYCVADHGALVVFALTPGYDTDRGSGWLVVGGW